MYQVHSKYTKLNYVTIVCNKLSMLAHRDENGLKKKKKKKREVCHSRFVGERRKSGKIANLGRRLAGSKGGNGQWEWNGWKMPDTLIAVIIAGLRRGRRGKNPNSGNNGPTSRRGSPLIKSTYDTQSHTV